MKVEADTENTLLEDGFHTFEKYYESFFDSVSDAIFLIDPTNYKVIHANKAALQQLKMDETEVVGKTCFEVCHRRSAVCEPPDHVCPIGKLMEENASVTVEHTHYDSGGNPVHVEVAASPVRDDEGNIVRVIHVSRDISERIRYEVRLETLHKHVLDLSFAQTVKEVAELTLAAVENVLGFNMVAFKVVEGGFLRFIHIMGDKADEAFEMPLDGPGVTVRAVRTGESQLVPDTRLDEDYVSGIGVEQTKRLSELAVPVKSEGEVVALINIESDELEAFTEEDRELLEIFSEHVASTFSRIKNSQMLTNSEGNLRKSEERIKNIFRVSPDGIMVTDNDGIIIECNQSTADLYGFDSSEELIGTDIYELIAEKDHEHSHKEVQDLKEKDSQKILETTFLKKDGTEFLAETSLAVMKDDMDNPIGIVGIIKDITERKKAQEALKDANEKWNSLTENSDDIITIIDREGTIQFINKTILTSTRENAIGMTVYDYLQGDQRDTLRESLRKALKTGQSVSYETSPYVPEVGTVWFSSKAIPLKHEGKSTGAILIATDITERKKAEVAREELLHNYGERQKELNCLYGFSKLVEKSEASLTVTFTKFVDLLPPAWQYPEVTCARVMHDDDVFQTDNFRETSWRQMTDIFVNGEKKGTIEVYYLEEMPEIHEGPFLREERELIESLATKIGNFLERYEANVKLREMVQELRERDEALRLLENPLLEVADNVVALPLIGVIDTRRASTMMESLLNHVAERDAELVILDMTGILSVDTATAQHIMQTIEAVRLMGSDAVITGIRPDVAVTLATLGVELAEIRTFSSLRVGIKHALNEG